MHGAHVWHTPRTVAIKHSHFITHVHALAHTTASVFFPPGEGTVSHFVSRGRGHLHLPLKQPHAKGRQLAVERKGAERKGAPPGGAGVPALGPGPEPADIPHEEATTAREENDEPRGER
eukprot:2646411-Prymnesium_polylepis.2